MFDTGLLCWRRGGGLPQAWHGLPGAQVPVLLLSGCLVLLRDGARDDTHTHGHGRKHSHSCTTIAACLSLASTLLLLLLLLDVLVSQLI